MALAQFRCGAVKFMCGTKEIYLAKDSKILSKELEKHPKIHYSSRLWDLKIRCGAENFRFGAKSR